MDILLFVLNYDRILILSAAAAVVEPKEKFKTTSRVFCERIIPGYIDLVSGEAMYKLLKTCQKLCKSKYSTASYENFVLQKNFRSPFFFCGLFYYMHKV